MGRKRKSKEDVKTSRSFRFKPSMWKLLEEEHKRLGNKTFVSTIEYIITKYFIK
jgi:hypothetical protein